jgi:hypothetical protein
MAYGYVRNLGIKVKEYYNMIIQKSHGSQGKRALLIEKFKVSNNIIIIGNIPETPATRSILL